ncbi:MAG: sigma-70 family RNA polymerase sigma factor [Tannerellaceae bacterium]|jgi:RNA polymerase sigma-70 factor (ECF subfamily)|nr:sigma-70 family RNA polymerase sigma factor [Tannerellaceae bacterium]
MKLSVDELLLEKLRHADARIQRQGFADMVNAYGQKLYWQIRKMVLNHDDANDLLQNTFLKAWMSLDNFRGEAKLSTWLYKIAVNECLTFLSKQQMRNSMSLEEADVFLADHLTADSFFDGDAAQKRLQEAVLRLPRRQRQVFNMKYFDEMKYEEMAEILGTSVGALKASYHHAVKKIEDYICSGNSIPSSDMPK